MSFTPVKNIKELNEYLETLEKRIVDLERENQELRQRNDRTIDEIARVSVTAPGMPATDLLNTSFIRRAFAVWGHYFVAQMIISVVVGVGYVLIMLLVMAFVSGQ